MGNPESRLLVSGRYSIDTRGGDTGLLVWGTSPMEGEGGLPGLPWGDRAPGARWSSGGSLGAAEVPVRDARNTDATSISHLNV